MLPRFNNISISYSTLREHFQSSSLSTTHSQYDMWNLCVYLSFLLFVGIIEANEDIRQIASFPGFAENIAIRSNADILVTSLTSPSIRSMNSKKPEGLSILPPIPGANGISGITEVQHEVFAIAAGIWNITARRGTNASVWTVNFQNTPDTEPALKKIVDIPETTALNGLAAIPGGRIVLGADSALGAIYAIDTKTRKYSIAIQDSSLAPKGPAPALGVNGIKIRGSYLYFTNSGTGLFGRIPISRTGKATGPVQTISQFFGSTFSAIDDFDLDEHGNAWVSFHSYTIFKVDSQGNQQVAVNMSDMSLDPTSVALGRGSPKERSTLYASTNILGDTITGVIAAVNLSSLPL